MRRHATPLADAPAATLAPARGSAPGPGDGPAATGVQIVDELADVVAIFSPAVQVCLYRRAPLVHLQAALARQAETGALTGFRRVLEADRPLPALPLPAAVDAAGAARELGLLVEIFGELLGCPRIGLRLELLHRPMCPRWHRDRNGIRLLCTWLGPGTEWLDDAAAPGADPAGIPSTTPPSGRAAPFDLVLLKGGLWQGNAGRGAIHRSPDPAASARCLVALDALWD
ncbi:DUF1826 domain-containing protein [Thiohalocapsa sp. ML1]|uniref:DUF1826 domain-containing protein n=1 Tax=Thiohalocapsa sp. ML1 TaxID=1431688 RepID=UPI0009E917F0|nr:DUF1826 domain-containing protein [Thiohalocapsa sp. ML1]